MMITNRPIDAAQTEAVQSRAADLQNNGETVPDVSIGLQTIDSAIVHYLANRIKPTIMQNDSQVVVPVLYGTAERWKSAQVDGVLKDEVGKIQLPLIVVQRSGMVKTAMTSPVNKQLNHQFATGWNRRTPYDRFAVVNGITPSKKLHITATPDYYDITYQGLIWTEYTTQMNSIVESISFESDEYWGSVNGYKFRSTIRQFTNVTELPETSDRMVRARFELTVHAYLLPDKMLDYYRRIGSQTRAEYTAKKVVTFIETEGG